ncbi:MAG TPA: hypothetical protein VMM60_17205 [Ilumatobacter sp.]|nr:hypothetical protein [Ilumatobacter sp.]
MDIMAVAQSIGLSADERGEMFGTIDETVVLAALEQLAAENPEHADVLSESILRVQLARSAGSERIERGSVLAQTIGAGLRQLRYRSEMGELFTDLAIDIGIRNAQLTQAGAAEVSVSGAF